MATTIPKLSEEQINTIIDGVRVGWLEDITVQYETEEDPYCRVVLKGHKFNRTQSLFEEVVIVLGEFRLKPDYSLRTFRRVSKQFMTLLREAKQVQTIAIHAEYSLHCKKKAA